MDGEGEIIALMFCYMVKVSWLLHCFRLRARARRVLFKKKINDVYVPESASEKCEMSEKFAAQPTPLETT